VRTRRAGSYTTTWDSPTCLLYGDSRRRVPCNTAGTRGKGKPVPEVPQLLVRERWLCESLIHEGAHGAMWRAFDQRLRRPVALRIVPAALIGESETRRRIDRLLRITAELQHDNMAYLYDVFEEDDLGVVLVSELVDGPTLDEFRERLAPISAEVIAAVGVQLADGLSAIHAGGLVHRALRPDHVRITWDGTVKILGFSATRLLADSTATPVGGVELERNYLAPEQLEGGSSDERTDIYTLGVVLWELTTGFHPFDAEPPSDASTRGVPLLTDVGSSVPASLAESIAIATRRDPPERWQDARRFIESIQDLCPARPAQVLRDVLAGALLVDPPTDA
jgi:eukaryotic-like serine/threonine-protein kinase